MMSAALRAMDAGELTAETLLGDCLARVDAREKEVLAWVAMDREAATANAKAADAAAWDAATARADASAAVVTVRGATRAAGTMNA